MASKKSRKHLRNLTVDDIAPEHGVDPETVRRWIRRGCPCDRPGKGKATLLNSAEVEVWKRENGITGERGRPDLIDSPDIEAARLRKENALASKYELQVSRERGELIPLADVKHWLGRHVIAFRNKLIGFAAGVTPHLEGRDAAERQAILESRLNEVLNELADASRSIGITTSAA